MWLVILLAIWMGGHSDDGSFVHDTVTRFMGLIVIAMGVQFALTGLREFLAGQTVIDKRNATMNDRLASRFCFGILYVLLSAYSGFARHRPIRFHPGTTARRSRRSSNS